MRVASGTWDFFSDQEFTGETMRLAPGEYADLGPGMVQEGRLVHVRPALKGSPTPKTAKPRARLAARGFRRTASNLP